MRHEARSPLLDLRLLRGLPGYVNGLTVGTLYFTGFTGGCSSFISVYLQEGPGPTRRWRRGC